MIYPVRIPAPLIALSAVLIAMAQAAPTANGESRFLRKDDFRISTDTNSASRGGTMAPAAIARFDFSDLGDTGQAMIATGTAFAAAWRSRCSDEGGGCDFFLTVTRRSTDSMATPGSGSELHARVFSRDSQSAVEITTRIIQDGGFPKLECELRQTGEDVAADPITHRKIGNYTLPDSQQGYQLKLSLKTTLGRQRLSVYSREMDGAFKMPQARMTLPAGFSADSIAFRITDPTTGSVNTLSDAFAGSRTWNYVTRREAEYIKKLTSGERPGKVADFDYFGEAVFLLIKSSEGSENRFGTWEAYKENLMALQNASQGGALIPIQILRTSIHEKSPSGRMAETPVFLCATPWHEFNARSAEVFIDPGSLYGEGALKEVKVKSGKSVRVLGIGEKMRIDFKDGMPSNLDLEVVYHDGFEARVPMTFLAKAKR